MSNQLQISGEAKIRAIQGPVVANSGVITALDGDASQYVRGDGTLADFPTSTGGGSSVSYYLNTSISQGTIGGVAYKQLSKVPIAGAGTDVSTSVDGYIASYITDANDPALLEVPAGNFNCEFYFSVNSDAHNPYVYAEVYKYDGTTFTLLGSSVSVPEYLTNGTTLSPYYFAIPVATSVLTVTDRIAIRIYVNVDTRTVTLHTENNHLCQVVTTFSKGLISLNNLTRQNQFFGTGTSGTDFAISSSVATHTFNLPVASASNTGKLSSTDWSTFNNKIGGSGTINTIPKFTASGTIGNSNLTDNGNTLEYAGAGFKGLELNSTNNFTSIRLDSYSAATNSDFGIKEIEIDGYYSSFNSYFGYNSSGAEWRIFGYADTAANTTDRATTTWQIPSLDGTYGYFDVKSQHSATPIIRAFASNNVVIGGSTNNSFKLEVVGTTKISGVLTLGSTISNGTYTYTLPSATGTLALTSQLSSYVPYTGATTNVDLGAFDLIASNGIFNDVVTINATSNQARALYMVTGTAGVQYGSGTGVNLFSEATDNLTILFTTASTTKNAILNGANLTATRTYTLPDASGTLALTSQLSSYVPYTGATTNVTLGTNTLTASTLIVDQGSTGTTLRFKQYGSASYNTNGFTDIYVVSNNIVGFGLNQGSGNFKGFSFNVINVTSNQSRDLYIPDASGTIALLSGTQTFTGATTFSSDITVNSVRVGRGSGSINTNTVLGLDALNANTTGASNVAIGIYSLKLNTTGGSNVGVGQTTLQNNNGNQNTAIGNQAMQLNTNGVANTGIGHTALQNNTTGNNNIAIGYESGISITTGSNNTIIGAYAGTTTLANNIVLADGAGNIRYQWNGTNNVFGNPISGTSATFSGNGSSFGSASVGSYPLTIQTNVSEQSIKFIGKNNNNNVQFFDSAGTTYQAVLGTIGSSFYIGTGTSGTSRLTITSAGAATFSGALTGTSASFSAGITSVGGSNQEITASATGDFFPRLKIIRTGGTTKTNRNYSFDLGSTGSLTLEDNTASATRLTIDISGNVGIGTSSPSSKLDVSGGITLSGNGSQANNSLFTLSNGYMYLDGNTNGLILENNNTSSTRIRLEAADNMQFQTASTERMRITSGGKVLINTQTTTAQNEMFTVRGEAAITYLADVTRYRQLYYSGNDNFYFYNGTNNAYLSSAGVWTNASDITIKKDIQDLQYGINEVLQLKPRLYKMKSNDLSQIGFIAQEVEEFLPELVDEDDKGMKGLSYGQMTAVLVKAIQESHQIIKDLEARIVTLEQK